MFLTKFISQRKQTLSGRYKMIKPLNVNSLVSVKKLDKTKRLLIVS